MKVSNFCYTIFFGNYDLTINIFFEVHENTKSLWNGNIIREEGTYPNTLCHDRACLKRPHFHIKDRQTEEECG